MDANRQRLAAILPNEFTNTRSTYCTPPFHFPLLDISSPMGLGCPQFMFTIPLTCQAFSPFDFLDTYSTFVYLEHGPFGSFRKRWTLAPWSSPWIATGHAAF
jgi:hypothetical protein